MSELQIIESALGRAAARRRWARALRGLWIGLLVGASLALFVFGVYKVYALPYSWVLAAGLIPLPFMLVGLIIAGWSRPPLRQVAQWVDGEEHLQERLSSALEFGKEPNAGRWSELVVSDAAEHAKNLDPRRIGQFRLPRRVVAWSLALLALCVGLGFVPEYRSQGYKQAKADEQNIKEVGRQLADLTRRNLQQRPPALEPTQKAMEAISDLGDQLQK